MGVDEGAAEDVDVVVVCADAKTHNRRIAAINSCERRLRIVVDIGERAVGYDDEKALLGRGHEKGIVLFMLQKLGSFPFNFCSDQIGFLNVEGCKPPTG